MKKIVKGFVCLLSLLAAGVAGATDFYWNPSKSSGNWTDAANWFTDAALTQPATAYPKTTSDFVRFNDGTEATITLGEKLTVHTLDLSKANLALTFVGGAGGTNNLLTVNNTFSPGGNNLKLTFDNAALYRNSAATFGEGLRLSLVNGSDFRINAPTFKADSVISAADASCLTFNGNVTLAAGQKATITGGSVFRCYNMTLTAGATELTFDDGSTATFNGALTFNTGTTLNVLGGSTLTVTGVPNMKCAAALNLADRSQMTVGGEFDTGGNSVITLDDSKLTGKGFFYFAIANNGGDHVVLKGANPVICNLSNYFRGNSQASSGGLTFDFEVPVGGFKEPPIQYCCKTDGTTYLFNGTSKSCPIYFNILATSPALTSTEYVTDAALTESASGTLRSTILYTGSDNAAPASAFRFTESDPTVVASSDATAIYTRVTLGSGAPAPTPEVAESKGVANRIAPVAARRTITVNSIVMALATQGKTVARLYQGESSDTAALSEVASTEITTPGTFALNWTAPKNMLETPYWFQLVLETQNDAGVVTYLEKSPVASASPRTPRSTPGSPWTARGTVRPSCAVTGRRTVKTTASIIRRAPTARSFSRQGRSPSRSTGRGRWGRSTPGRPGWT